MKEKKHLILTWHGLSVLYDVPKYVTALPMALCRHAECMFKNKELKSIKEVISWVETIKQPIWVKKLKIGKYHIDLVKYEN